MEHGALTVDNPFVQLFLGEVLWQLARLPVVLEGLIGVLLPLGSSLLAVDGTV